MKIMHLSRAAETLWWFLIPTIEEQKRRGHEVVLCTEGADAEKLRGRGYEVIRHGMPRSINPLVALRAIWRIRTALRAHRADAVICHNSLAGIVGRIAAWLAGTPHVVYFAHGLACGPAQKPRDWQLRFQIEKRLAPLTDAIVVMNDYDEHLSRTTPLARTADRVFRIRGMGVDLSRFVPAPFPEIRARLGAELGVDPSHTFVLCVARLIPEKGVLDFVEAARRVCESRHDVIFLLAGSGPLLDMLRRQVKEGGIGEQAKVLGWRDDISDLMKAADVFVLPSYYMEGLPVSILEAMASGKPVVTTHHKGCEDAVVDGETAFLVPVQSPALLAEKILALLGDAGLRREMGSAGRRRVEEVFEIEDCTLEVVTTLERAIARPAAAGRPIVVGRPSPAIVHGYDLRPCAAPAHARDPKSTRCAFTVDVEDWYQSTVDFDAPITDRVLRNMDRVRSTLDEFGIKGTFFIQGRVAETFPRLVQELLAEGHEIQSHGYSHRPLFSMDRAALRTELEYAVKTVEDACGVRVTAFRAPDFSIGRENLWALEVLAESGFEVDSSIFPMKTSRYGIDGWEMAPHRVGFPNGSGILEVPVAIATFGSLKLPVAGGGYFRALPMAVLERSIHKILSDGRPAILYCHPYEWTPGEMDEYRGRVNPFLAFTQSLGRDAFIGRMRRLFATLPFGRFDQVIAGWHRVAPPEAAGEPVPAPAHGAAR
jgi:polysaccharide deacetylase family protein (PEP-CTERM system associated)